MRLDTINVIERVDNSIINVVSFQNNREGKIQADKHFRFYVLENYPETPLEDLQDCIEFGIDNYFTYIVQSNT